MNLILKNIFVAFFILTIISCSSDDDSEKDLEKPTITIDYNGGFPKACQQLKRGETYTFKAMVTDNEALASYSLDIHHNFDHHTHDDQAGECDLEEKKDAVNPLIFIENYTIKNGLSSYEIVINLTIPEDVDTGDYHCSYSVTDETGWQSRTSVDIKIVE
ncbi:DUF4625 domain-containing protein [Aureibaculum marinum]|uniref:DUF4625 domain-containing protein n=1 Tax=Aureibaculum marinum TaxID=2487930 RepID=A0A3N4P4Y4_9FLAO|nr:DUF4625 domain-containing protein [Aureibaculum marinum]RPD99956.1 DUF4625 domain-containing protein [Aureibaculum marinum]